jgi:hypothetical protein
MKGANTLRRAGGVHGDDRARPAPSSRHSRILSALILLLGLLISIPISCYVAVQNIGGDFVLRDASWPLDLVSRLHFGELAGRDFVFTYGPLYQLTHAFGLIIPPGDLASVMRFHPLLEALVMALGVWYVLRLTGSPLAWRATTYLLWTLGWAAGGFGGIKPLVGLFAAIACGHAIAYAAPEHDGPPQRPTPRRPRIALLRHLFWMLPAPVMFLYAFDMGIITLLVLVGTTGAALVSTLFVPGEIASAVRRRAVEVGVVVLIGAIVFALLLSLPGAWSHYFVDSLALANGYTQKMAISCSGKKGWLLLLAFVVAGAVVLVAMLVLRFALRARPASVERALMFLGSACFGLIWMRYGITRCAPMHVLVALVPLLFIAACLLPNYLRAEKMWLAFPAIAFAVILLALPIVVPSAFGAPSLRQRAAALARIDLAPARLRVETESMREAVDIARSLPGKAVYVWPYLTVINLAVDKASPSYTVQNYAATDETLEQATIKRLRAVPHLHAILFTNDPPLDEIEDLTRTSHIFRYLLDNYELAGEPHAEFTVLKRTGTEQPKWREAELGVAASRFAPGGADAVLKVELPPESCRAKDMLVLRLRATKTSNFGIFKGGVLRLTFVLSNGMVRTQVVPLAADGAPHELLLSASTLRDDRLAETIFAPAVATESMPSGEQVTRLEFRWSPLDALSRHPQEIALERVARLERAR